MRKVLIILLLISFTFSYADPYSDIRLEILSKIKVLEEKKSKEKNPKKKRLLEKKIKELKNELEKYNNNLDIIG
ncbi:hypothetical protein [Hydrogenothermus marinus]|uniref:Uncharacterized protein n=1 Tax=Hydrogenothermus marinus TaxID=133270 RepID=A0A3M0BI81_9AQUI|nr:hypothetical protein [Hydrogenothermus marinus]RMA96029.1 hypothetical protein CLV39_1040 [Hydrogenothermus marinus]